jgi:hypothetical protein
VDAGDRGSDESMGTVPIFVRRKWDCPLRRCDSCLFAGPKKVGPSTGAMTRPARQIESMGTVPIFVRREWDCPLRRCDSCLFADPKKVGPSTGAMTRPARRIVHGCTTCSGCWIDGRSIDRGDDSPRSPDWGQARVLMR